MGICLVRDAMSKYLTRRVGPWGLTPTEADTIRMLASGLKLTEISAIRSRSTRTTESHGTKAKEKMGAETLVRAAVLFALWEAGGAP
jgi:DNA-binding CsgD family transcriptional regulator